MKSHRPVILGSLIAACALIVGGFLPGCQGVDAPRGLWEAQLTGGPAVVFDLFARPLPEVPLPNDIATRPDPESPTGRRVNASMIAPTQLESGVRERLDTLDGWGTYGSITVKFTPVDQLLDIGNILRRHTGDDFDFTDDAIYLVNIDPSSPDFGVPTPIDLGEGDFPLNLQERDRYYDNDPRGQTNNILLETTYEDTNGNGRLDLCEDINHDGVTDPGEDLDGDGVAFSAERDENGNGVLDPEEDLNGNGRLDCSEDTDFDGHLDFPNLYCGNDRDGRRIPPWECPAVTIPNDLGDVTWAADDAWLVSFYEMETNTLAMRPVIPMAERTEYAVVLTDRLVDEEGRAVESPFPTGYHIDQTASAHRLEQALAAHPEYYGGLTTENVQFMWAFTTQTVTGDMHDVREGLYGRGPLRELSGEFPPVLMLDVLHGCSTDAESCTALLPDNRYTLQAHADEPGQTGLIDVLEQIAADAFDVGPQEYAALSAAYDFVDYMVAVRFYSPNFLDNDGNSEDLDGDGRLDEQNEDLGNGVLDPGEDLDGDGNLDVDEDVNCNGVLDEGEDRDGDGRLDLQDEDLGNGILDPGEDLDIDGNLDVNEDVNCNRVMDGEEGYFDVNTGQGHAPHNRHMVSALITIPKADPEHGIEPPFPVVFYGHGYTSSRIESLGFAGNLAKFGFASIGVECVHHGLQIDEGIMMLIDAMTSLYRVTGLGASIRNDRARDLNGDGVTDPGGDFWTAYVFHTRDVVRQSGIDHIRMIQILRSFDGELMSGVDYNADGVEDLAGDFNGDGVVDLGGPDNQYHIWGQSLGGIMSGFLAGLEPAITTSVPVSGGGGLGDVGIRSTQGGVKEAVILRMMGPLFITRPAWERYNFRNCTDCRGECVDGVCRCSDDADCVGGGQSGYRCTEAPEHFASQDRVCAKPRDDTVCGMNQISARFLVPDLNDDGLIEYACLDPDELHEGDTIIAVNKVNGERGCFVAWPGGRSRIHLPSDLHDEVELQIYEGDVLVDTDECLVREGEEPTRVIDQFEVDAAFQFDTWTEGERLVTPAEGHGLKRATPEIRRFMGIAQTVLEPADPANMALRYFSDPVDFGPETGPTNVLVVATIGDMNVPVNTGISIARAASILDIATPDPRLADADHPYGRTANRYLIDNEVYQGLERLSTFRRESDGVQVLFDPDDLDRSASPPTSGWTGDELGAPSDPVPLRAWTPTVPGETCTCLDASGEHDCTWPGDTVGPLEMVRCEHGVSALIMPYLRIDGEHGFALPEPWLPFDIHSFMINQLGYYFSTGGTELRYNVCLETSTCTVEEDGFYTPPLHYVEVCDDEVDGDFDGLVDCDDPDCADDPACE